MDPRRLFFDDRFAICVYCGGRDATRDHVPSKVLLDEPYPDNLPVVGACQRCNSGFSDDERYVACLIECARTGFTDGESVTRPKIRRILNESPSLALEMRAARRQDASGISWEFDPHRVNKVVMKLARGHYAYECGETMLQQPQRVVVTPLHVLSSGALSWFETPPPESVFPEIGSRAFFRVLVDEQEVHVENSWHVVQPDRYRYLVSYSGQPTVRFILSEYLACEVVW